MNWRDISKQPELSESFIEEHAANVDWISIATTQPLSLDFIQKHKDSLFLSFLKQNPHLVSHTDELHKIFDYEELPFIQAPSRNYMSSVRVRSFLDPFDTKQEPCFIPIGSGRPPATFGTLSLSGCILEETLRLIEEQENNPSTSLATSSHSKRNADEEEGIFLQAPTENYTSPKPVSWSSFDSFDDLSIDDILKSIDENS